MIKRVRRPWTQAEMDHMDWTGQAYDVPIAATVTHEAGGEG